MQIFPLQDVSILENEFVGMTDISCWLLMTIAKKWSTHSGFYSCEFLVFGTFVWRMIMLFAMLTWMKIKTLIFHVAHSMTALAFRNLLLNWSRWMWTFLNKSSTLKLDQFGIIRNMESHFLFISNTYSMLIVSDFLPRFDDWIGKRKLNLSMHNFIFICTYIWSWLIEMLLSWLLIWIIIIIIFEKRVVLNKDYFRISNILSFKFIMKKSSLSNATLSCESCK